MTLKSLQVLDEEAEVFVVKMWRLLVYETEAKKLGLVKWRNLIYNARTITKFICCESVKITIQHNIGSNLWIVQWRNFRKSKTITESICSAEQTFMSAFHLWAQCFTKTKGVNKHSWVLFIWECNASWRLKVWTNIQWVLFICERNASWRLKVWTNIHECFSSVSAMLHED